MTANEKKLAALREKGHVTVSQLRLTTEHIALITKHPEENRNGELVVSLARPRHDLKTQGLELSGKGGVTAVLFTPEGDADPVAAYAICNEKDNFSRSLGLTIAIGRLESQLS